MAAALSRLDALDRPPARGASSLSNLVLVFCGADSAVVREGTARSSTFLLSLTYGNVAELRGLVPNSGSGN